MQRYYSGLFVKDQDRVVAYGTLTFKARNRKCASRKLPRLLEDVRSNISSEFKDLDITIGLVYLTRGEVPSYFRRVKDLGLIDLTR